MTTEEKIKLICRNRKAYFEYTIDDLYEAGLVLRGTEVKSLRLGKANIQDAFARFRGGALFLYNAHISPYPHAAGENHDPTRPRKLLLHRLELKRLAGKVQERGFTLIPLKLYFKDQYAKLN
jgi:SsrA-binding protein